MSRHEEYCRGVSYWHQDIFDGGCILCMCLSLSEQALLGIGIDGVLSLNEEVCSIQHRHMHEIDLVDVPRRQFRGVLPTMFACHLHTLCPERTQRHPPGVGLIRWRPVLKDLAQTMRKSGTALRVRRPEPGRQPLWIRAIHSSTYKLSLGQHYKGHVQNYSRIHPHEPQLQISKLRMLLGRRARHAIRHPGVHCLGFLPATNLVTCELQVLQRVIQIPHIATLVASQAVKCTCGISCLQRKRVTSKASTIVGKAQLNVHRHMLTV
mmetsp:Transcript_6685/g.25024  ORF Transcript_6685/g.25024 Transcript_6685/m.25024 type:complete len:265 (+) Transcript_6685:705-1499(+)